MSRVDEAKQVVDDLETKRRVLGDKRESLTGQIVGLSFDGATGDKTAAKALERLRADRTVLDAEIETLDAALPVARLKLVEAEAAAARAADRAMMEAAKGRIDVLKAAAAELDEAVRKIVAAYSTFNATAASFSREFHIGPSRELTEVAARRALQALLQAGGMGLEFERRSAPNERRSFASLAATWASNIDAAATRRIAAPVPTAASVEKLPAKGLSEAAMAAELSKDLPTGFGLTITTPKENRR